MFGDKNNVLAYSFQAFDVIKLQQHSIVFNVILFTINQRLKHKNRYSAENKILILSQENFG